MSEAIAVSRNGESIPLPDENVAEYLDLVPALVRMPHRAFRSSYDAEADVLYLNFKKPSAATDSELTDDDIIVRMKAMT